MGGASARAGRRIKRRAPFPSAGPQSREEPPRHIRRPQEPGPAGPRYIRAGLLYKAEAEWGGRQGRGQVRGRPSSFPPPGEGAAGSPRGPGSQSELGVEGSGNTERVRSGRGEEGETQTDSGSLRHERDGWGRAKAWSEIRRRQG